MVGDQEKAEEKVVSNCPCAKVDFEWYVSTLLFSLATLERRRNVSEFNYVKNANDDCVLVPGTTPLPDDDSCKNGEEYWYERTAYRLIPYSSCKEGLRLDRGKQHTCPGFSAHGAFFWLFVLAVPFGFTALVGYYYYRKSGRARG